MKISLKLMLVLGLAITSINTQAKHKQEAPAALVNQDNDCGSCCNQLEQKQIKQKKSVVAEKTLFQKITDSWCSVKCWFINIFDKDDCCGSDDCDTTQAQASKDLSEIETTGEDEDTEDENIPHKLK